VYVCVCSVRVYVRVCMCVCVYICHTHTNTHTHTHTSTHTHKNTRTHTRTHTQTHTHGHTHVHTYTHTHTHTHAHTHTPPHTYPSIPRRSLLGRAHVRFVYTHFRHDKVRAVISDQMMKKGITIMWRSLRATRLDVTKRRVFVCRFIAHRPTSVSVFKYVCVNVCMYICACSLRATRLVCVRKCLCVNVYKYIYVCSFFWAVCGQFAESVRVSFHCPSSCKV